MSQNVPYYLQSVVPIEFSQEFLVPEGKVFLIKVRYENPTYGPQYEETTFMINSEKTLRKIMSHNEDNPWHPVDDYKLTWITYLDNSSKSVYKPVYMDLLEPRIHHDDIDGLLLGMHENDFLRKAFNAMLINYESRWQYDLNYEETYYACYVYIPKYNVFVAKMSDEVVPGEHIFLGEIDINVILDYYQSKPNLINEEYLRKFLYKESYNNIISFQKLLSENHPRYSKVIVDFYYYFIDFKMDLAKLKLREMGIKVSPDIPYSKYW